MDGGIRMAAGTGGKLSIGIGIAWLSLAAGVTAAGAAGPPLASAGDWTLARADGPSPCILATTSPSRVQVVGSRLEVTGLPKESLFNYQYRIDDQPVSNAMIPSPAMQEAGAIWFEGDAFDAILKGRRFQIRILDRWHEAITEDVSLNGLRSLQDQARTECR